MDEANDTKLNKAQVRFRTTDSSNQRNKIDKHLIAIITYMYSDLELTLEERNINPLGFQVIEYKVDNEIL